MKLDVIMKKMFVILGLLTGLFIVTGCATSSSLRDGKLSVAQRQYLDDHEEELVDFVSSYNEGEIHSVQFKWETADVKNVSNGLPQGAGYVIRLEGTFNNTKSNNFTMHIWLDDDGNPDLHEVYFLHEPAKNGEPLPDTSFSEELQYLKASEEALVTFVRSYNEDEIHSVKFDWDTGDMRNVQDGTKEGAGAAIQLRGTFNDSENNRFEIRIWLDDYGTPDVTRIDFLLHPSKNGKILPEKPSK